MLIDSHAHLTAPEFDDEDIDAVLLRAKDAGVTAIVNICTDVASLQKGLLLQKKYPNIYLAASTTPHDVASQGEEDFLLLSRAAKEGKLVAVGETGLDYYYEHSPRGMQREFLERYLSLADTCKLPVVIHCREAFHDFFEVLAAYPGVMGVLHCFTGTLEEARQVLDRGWYLSLSGIVTFKKSEELREVARYVPLDRLAVETDAPFLAPQSKRGKRNEPSFLPETVETIAREKGLSFDQVAQATVKNARALFKLTS